VGGKDRTAGNAEYRVGADLLERANEGLCARDVLDGRGLSSGSGPGLRVMGPGGLLGHRLLFSMLRVFAKFVRVTRAARQVPVQQKTPRAERQARGSAPGGWSLSDQGSASADALSKYEDS